MGCCIKHNYASVKRKPAYLTKLAKQNPQKLGDA